MDMLNIDGIDLSNLYTWDDLELYMQVADPNLLEFMVEREFDDWPFTGKPFEKQVPFHPSEQWEMFNEPNASFVCLAGQEVSLRLRRLWQQLHDLNPNTEFLGMHLYASKDKGMSFPVHLDRPNNLIIQAQGKTKWTLYAESGNIDHTYAEKQWLDEYDFNIETQTTLKEGETLWIPSRRYHVAEPGKKRLSVSVMFR